MDWGWYANDRARTKAPWGGRKTSKSPTGRGKSEVKRRLRASGHEVPVTLATEEAKRQGMKRVQPPGEGIVLELAPPIRAEQQPHMGQALSDDSDEKQGLLHELDFPAQSLNFVQIGARKMKPGRACQKENN